MNSKSRILNTAVIGLGRIGWQTHIPEIIKHPGFNLCAVVDPLPERLQEARMEFGVEQLYLSTDELYDEIGDNLDLVVIASPTNFHCSQALEAFKHGCDVFCDKPLAMSLKEVDEMIAGMEHYGRKLMVFQPRRLLPHIKSLREIIDSSIIGEVFLVKRSVSNFTRRCDWQAFKANGGGMLYNYGSHYIDQFFYLFKTSCRDVHCELFNMVSGGDAEDVVKAFIKSESGILFDMEINMACSQETQPWMICGTRGSITCDSTQNAWKVKYCLPEDLPPVNAAVELAAAGRKYVNGEVIPWREKLFKPNDNISANSDFYAKCYDYFGLGKTPFVSVAETREVMRTLEMCF